MTGDYTSVPLRPDGPRWLGAKMQQGRVLLDGDWNMNVDAAEREREDLATAVIGEAGVLDDSTAFQVSFGPENLLQIGAGQMWVGGLCAVNPFPLQYAAQESVPDLPQSGTVLVYLDTVVQEIQPAEDPGELIDPAMDGVDTTTRTRVAWRVRFLLSDATSCGAAAQQLPAATSSGRLDVVRTAPALPSDPCAPPDDPRGKLPDGLLRIEVLDSGTASTARFGWSYENGSAAVAATVTGDQVTLAPSPSTRFSVGDLVEVSTLVRRLDRLNTGALFTSTGVTPGAAGSVVTLSSPTNVVGTPSGLCLRRWDGQVVGATTAVAATLGGNDVGIAFSARDGQYLAGDWWSVQVRGSAADAVQPLTNAAPDGVQHRLTPLALVDLTANKVLSDCRPKFTPLTSVRPGTCTVTAFPGDDLQAAADRLPVSGGELCLAAGIYQLSAPVAINAKQRVVINGVGPSTVLSMTGHEAVLQFTECTDVCVQNLRAESGAGADSAARQGEEHLLGTLSFLGCSDITVRDCELVCPDNTGRTQSTFYSAPSDRQPNARNRIVGNKIQVGDQQTGILVVSSDETHVADNEIRLGPAPQGPIRVLPRLGTEFSRYIASALQPAVASPAVPAAKATKATKAVTPKVKLATGAADPAKVVSAIKLASGDNISVTGPQEIQRIASQFAKLVPAAKLDQTTPREALQKFVRRAVLAPETLKLSAANLKFIGTLSTNSRTMGQGIVVAGERAGLVRIHDNLVDSVIEGIHVGVRSGKTAVSAGEVMIRNNVVHCLIPYFWSRSRHAIYVGSVDKLTLQDNSASLLRNGTSTLYISRVPPSVVEAVRIYGRIGPWVSVRGLVTTGTFKWSLAITDLNTPLTLHAAAPPPGQLRYVSDVLNSQAGGLALRPSFPYQYERCVPLP